MMPLGMVDDIALAVLILLSFAASGFVVWLILAGLWLAFGKTTRQAVPMIDRKTGQWVTADPDRPWRRIPFRLPDID